MRLATFVDPLKGNGARIGILRGENIVDVVSAADALHRAVPGYESVGWFGLLAPAKTPPEIVNKINAAIVEAEQTKEFRDHLATLGAEPRPQTPEEFGRYINADIAKWAEIVKDNNVKLPGAK